MARLLAGLAVLVGLIGVIVVALATFAAVEGVPQDAGSGRAVTATTGAGNIHIRPR